MVIETNTKPCNMKQYSTSSHNMLWHNPTAGCNTFGLKPSISADLFVVRRVTLCLYTDLEHCYKRRDKQTMDHHITSVCYVCVRRLPTFSERFTAEVNNEQSCACSKTGSVYQKMFWGFWLPGIIKVQTTVKLCLCTTTNCRCVLKETQRDMD